MAQKGKKNVIRSFKIIWGPFGPFWTRYISKLRLGQDFGAEFRSTFDGGVLILKLKFGGDSEAELRDTANIKP